jgi:uncharacterized protein YuzE
MTLPVRITLDPAADVLYVKVDQARIADSMCAPHDDLLIFNMDPSGQVVGVQLLGASDLPIVDWVEHPDRSMLPMELLDAIDACLRKGQNKST